MDIAALGVKHLFQADPIGALNGAEPRELQKNTSRAKCWSNCAFSLPFTYTFHFVRQQFPIWNWFRFSYLCHNIFLIYWLLIINKSWLHDLLRSWLLHWKGHIPCDLLALCLKEVQPTKNYVCYLSSKLTQNRTFCRMRVEYYKVWQKLRLASLIGIPAPPSISNVIYRNVFDMSEPVFSSKEKSKCILL